MHCIVSTDRVRLCVMTLTKKQQFCLNSIDLLVFVMKVQCVYCEAGSVCSNLIQGSIAR